MGGVAGGGLTPTPPLNKLCADSSPRVNEFKAAAAVEAVGVLNVALPVFFLFFHFARRFWNQTCNLQIQIETRTIVVVQEA